MPNECRPPPGTPNGTVCVLMRDTDEWFMVWHGIHWFDANDTPYDPASLAIHGWRFHSIAEPPNADPR